MPMDGEDQRRRAKYREQQHVEALPRGGLHYDFIHGAHAGYGESAAGLA